MKVQVIVPSHNRKKYLGILLDCLKSQTVPIDILVVVDGSTDGTLEMLNKEYSKVDYILGNGDWWYTKSMNEGFKYALKKNDPDFFLTMNDDTEVRENYVEKLLVAYKKVEKRSLVGSLSYTKKKPHRILTSGSFFWSRPFCLSKNYLSVFEKVKFSKINGQIFESNVLSGRGMLIPVETLLDLKFFDEKFKQYHSDSDFCLKALKKNYKVYISWDAQVLVNEKMTGSGTSFVKESFVSLFKKFFHSTSRLYLPSKSRILWRHGSKMLWPISIIIFISVSIRNNLSK